jgi:PAS domain S-box-containing protein
MADNAPVLLWLSSVDGLCCFFNQTWLRFTGRSMDDELGTGWAEGVHAEDFQECMHTYLDAFVVRQAFEMEYRLRRHDGAYRWVYDMGAPLFADDGTFSGFIGSCVDVTDQRLAREALREINLGLAREVRERSELAHQRELLLKEVHHRVKNDLQLISSMLRMQERQLDDAAAAAALDECRARVQTVALMHEHMHLSEKSTHVPLSAAVKTLAGGVFQLAAASAPRVTLALEVDEDVNLAVDQAVPCGLVLNELLVNSLKHAFPEGRSGRVRVVLASDAESVTLRVSDDGVGWFGRPTARPTLGWRLVESFADQLHASLSVDDGPGTSVELRIPRTSSSHQRKERHVDLGSRG